MKIRLLCLMEGNFEDVIYDGTIEKLIKDIEESKVITIYLDKENGKEIYINSNYIMSFEL